MYHLVLLIAVALAAARHTELLGEDPDQEDIDNGQCIPIKCYLGVPPAECTRLCSLRKYVPTCNTHGNFCLCQRLVGGSIQLVSPDEVVDQPASEESTESFSIFAVILPFTRIFTVDSTPPPTPEPFEVNIHEGRLYWDFRYILSGLLLLMAALIIYELLLCRKPPTYDREVVEKTYGTGVEEIKKKVFTA